MFSHPPKKILILKLQSIGDSILALPHISFLRRIFPDAEIVYGTNKKIPVLYREVEIDANKVITIYINGIAGWCRTFFALKRQKFDLIIELFQRKSSSRFFKFFSFVTGTPYFYQNNYPEGDRSSTKSQFQLDLEGIWNFCKQYSVDTLEKTPPRFADYFPARFVVRSTSFRPNTIVLGITAGKTHKIWPLPNFIQLCKLLVEKNSDYKIIIPLEDNSAGLNIERQLKDAALPSQVSWLKVSLDKMPTFVSGTSLFIGNDSGPRHICAALGVKTCTLFSTEHPSNWHPYNINDHPFFHYDRSIPGNLFDAQLDPRNKQEFLKMLPAKFVFDRLLSRL